MLIELSHVNYSYGRYYLLGRIQINAKNAHFPKNECMRTRVHKNGHNSAYDPYVFMLAPLDSAHIELSIHARNSILMKYPLFSYIAGHKCVLAHTLVRYNKINVYWIIYVKFSIIRYCIVLKMNVCTCQRTPRETAFCL